MNDAAKWYWKQLSKNKWALMALDVFVPCTRGRMNYTSDTMTKMADNANKLVDKNPSVVPAFIYHPDKKDKKNSEAVKIGECADFRMDTQKHLDYFGGTELVEKDVPKMVCNVTDIPTEIKEIIDDGLLPGRSIGINLEKDFPEIDHLALLPNNKVPFHKLAPLGQVSKYNSEAEIFVMEKEMPSKTNKKIDEALLKKQADEKEAEKKQEFESCDKKEDKKEDFNVDIDKPEVNVATDKKDEKKDEMESDTKEDPILTILQTLVEKIDSLIKTDTEVHDKVDEKKDEEIKEEMEQKKDEQEYENKTTLSLPIDKFESSPEIADLPENTSKELIAIYKDLSEGKLNSLVNLMKKVPSKTSASNINFESDSVVDSKYPDWNTPDASGVTPNQAVSKFHPSWSDEQKKQFYYGNK